eukprot:5522474-Pleurochrysis_carterae.AAC.1
MADPAAAATPAADPAPANPPDAEAAAAAARNEHCLLFQRKLTEMVQAKSGMNTTLLTEEDAKVIRLALISQWQSRSAAKWKKLYGKRPWKWRGRSIAL